MVEVKTKTSVKYSMEIVVVEGQFAVLKNDPYGLYYRLTDAVAVKSAALLTPLRRAGTLTSPVRDVSRRETLQNQP